jgi:hypothetical protein
MKPFKLIYIFIALGWHLSIAQSPVVLSIGEDKLIGKNISFYVDESQSNAVDEVSSNPCTLRDRCISLTQETCLIRLIDE